MGELQIQREKQEEVGKQIRSWEKFVASVLPRHMNRDAGRIVRVILTEFSRVPKLYECTPVSQYGCIMQASQLGLEIGGALGFAYLIPRKIKETQTCTLQIGYKGLVELARRSGQIADIWAEVVYKDDDFSFNKGDRVIVHKEPERTSAPSDDDIKAAYAVILFKDGTRHPQVMQRWQLNRIAAKSVERGSSFYGNWYPEWCMKTAVKQALRFAPKSPEIQRAINLDDDAEIGRQKLDLPIGSLEGAMDVDFTDAPGTNGDGADAKGKAESDTGNGGGATPPDPVDEETTVVSGSSKPTVKHEAQLVGTDRKTHEETFICKVCGIRFDGPDSAQRAADHVDRENEAAGK